MKRVIDMTIGTNVVECSRVAVVAENIAVSNREHQKQWHNIQMYNYIISVFSIIKLL